MVVIVLHHLPMHKFMVLAVEVEADVVGHPVAGVGEEVVVVVAEEERVGELG